MTPADAAHEQALAEVRAGRWNDAEPHARRAMEFGGDRYAGTLGQILIRTGKLSEAEDRLRSAIAADASDLWSHVGLATVYSERRQLAQALAILDRILAIDPAFPGAQQDRDVMASELATLRHAAELPSTYARDRGLDAGGGVSIASAVVDENGAPRFTMMLPMEQIGSDLGAAHVFCRDVFEGGYERPLRQFLDRHLMSDDVFIDVGAHWGIHALSAATRRPGIDVLAIEAHPANAERLREPSRRGSIRKSSAC